MVWYMVNSPLHICGCGFHLRWSYDLRYTGVDVDANTTGEAKLWGVCGEALECFILTFKKVLLK